MEIKLIELYCLICHFYDTQSVLNQQRMSNNSKPAFTDQELVTCYFFGMLNNHYQQQEIYDYIVNHWRSAFPDLPTYQAFNNRLNNLATHFVVITDLLLSEKHRFLAPNETEDSLIDSFPVMLKRGKNAKSGRVACEIADFGYCSSKDIYYHGVKLHNLAVRRTKTLPLPFQIFLSKASKHDLVAFKDVAPRVPTRNLFADKAYKDNELKLALEENGVTLLTPPKKKKNDLPQFYEPLWSKFVSRFKQPIESFFNWLNEKTDYQNASKVRSKKGLLVHCYGKLAFACLLLCFYS
jgi:hypothetical protein